MPLIVIEVIKASDRVKETLDILEQRIDQFVRDLKTVRATNNFDDMAIGTTLGSVREVNQDRALVVNASYYNAPNENFLLGVVCDGMGGLPDGDEAAIIAISVFTAKVLRTIRLPVAERLSRAVSAANEALFQKFHGRSGTTLSAVLIGRNERPIAVTVGDTRVYGLTNLRDLKQLSRDDTFAGLLGEGKADPSRKNQLVQYVGMGEGIEPNIIYTYKNDFSWLLIATDGVHSAPSSTLPQIIKNSKTSVETVKRLVDLNEILGGKDNGTALVIPSKGVSDSLSVTANKFRFWSASEQIEIWIPAHTGMLDSEVPPISESVLPKPAGKDKEQTILSLRKKRKPNKNQAVQKKKKRGGEEDAWLPIEEVEKPMLSIRFPEKRRR